MHDVRIRLLVAYALLGLTACLGQQYEGPSVYLRGVVLSETDGGAPIAKARISIDVNVFKLTADNAGYFAGVARIKEASEVVVTVSADGFAPRSYIHSYEAGTLALVATLRRIDKKTTVALPTAGEPPAQVNVARGEGAATVEIPADALVRRDGSIASGTVDVAVTYWNPTQSMRSAPGMLYTNPVVAGDAPRHLRTYGMAEIEISQNGELLQVAPHKTLGLQFKLPAPVLGHLKAIGTADYPSFYSMNRSTGLWDVEGTFADGSMTFDVDNGLVGGRLPHLSAWNLDGLDPGNGGCVRGRVLNLCGQPARNFRINLWFMAWEELVRFPGRTDANGNYCVNVGLPDITASHPTNIAPYYVAGANSVHNSNQCHAVNATSPRPFPQVCEACGASRVVGMCCRYQMDYAVPNGVCSFNDPIAQMGTQGACGGCGNTGNAAFTAAGGSLVSFSDCHTICPNIPRVNVTACNWCSGSGGLPGTCWAGSVVVPNPVADSNRCDRLIDIVVNDGLPACQPPPPDPCTTARARFIGESCDSSTVCCPASSGLLCSDFLCVPGVDPAH